MITVETERKVIMEKSYWLKKLCWQTKNNVTECVTLNNVDSHSENRAFSYNYLMNNDGLQQKNKTQTNLKDLVLRERLVGQNIRNIISFRHTRIRESTEILSGRSLVVTTAIILHFMPLASTFTVSHSQRN